MAPTHPPPPSPPLARLWGALRDYSTGAGAASLLWPRWLVLRAVGLVYLVIFAGILAEIPGLVGPRGIAPLGEFFAQLAERLPHRAEALLEAPSLFWLGSGAGAISVVTWLGLASALALVLNLWPRAALAGCWLAFLSFVSTWRVFSPAQLDGLMLEVALLCLPFAPPGFRPGLAAASPPRPIAVFMLRWLLFRVMFESGLVKLVAGDPRWRDLTAMEVMYETSPFPTILGYLDHQLPHAWHLGEIALTFAAELVAPVLAFFGGRRGRWFAFWAWTVFQAGIQLTGNFGWLNTASLALGLLLLDDGMLAAAAGRLRLARLRDFLVARASAATTAPPAPAWRRHGLRVALGVHFALTLVFFAKACGVPAAAMPPGATALSKLLSGFRSAQEYSLYATFEPARYQVEFEGSNDAGRTWRAYAYRYAPQREDRIGPFLAPWFCRFEATLEIAVWAGKKSPLVPAVAAHLLARNPDVMRLFARDPFPDRAPTIVRMRGYRLAFTDLATLRATGRYWRRESAGDYHPAMHENERGEIAPFSLAAGDAALGRGDYRAAFAFFDEQYRLGNLDAGYRLADVFARGLGFRPDPVRAHAVLAELAASGEIVAEHSLGLCHEFGVGVPVDYAQAAAFYRRAADRGYLPARQSLGALHAADRVTPRDDLAGLALLLEVERRLGGNPDPALARGRAALPAQIERLKSRLSPAAIAEAARRAAARR